MPEWKFKILIDGECPLCRCEADVLRWLDDGRGRLVIEDIAAPGFDPAEYGTTMDEVMDQVHGVTSKGTLVKGMAVFRHAYEAVGMGWLLAPTNWPLLRHISDAGYSLFAKNRLRLTGRRAACYTDRCRTE